MKTRLVIPISLIVLIAGCGTVKYYVNYRPISTLELGKQPKNPEQVQVYSEGAELPNRPYKVVGTIAISTLAHKSMGMTEGEGYITLSAEVCYAQLQKEAARRGGDAVIHVEYVSEEKYETTIRSQGGWGVGSGGGGGGYQTYGQSGPVTHGAYIGELIVW